MVTLSDDFLEKTFGGSKGDFEKSHLILPNVKIKKIVPLKKFKKTQLLDLRSNYIPSTLELRNLTLLRYLFLQNNDISKLDGFTNMRNLEILYLDFNRIEVVENLDMCPLKKLSLRGQRLSSGKHLLFDGCTLNGFSYQLEVLNLSKNGLSTLSPLRYLYNLDELDVSDNRLTGMDDIRPVLRKMHCLKTLNLLRNPCMKIKSAAKWVIANVYGLETLNCLPVHPSMKNYCQHMAEVGCTGDEEEEEDATQLLKEAVQRSLEDLPVAIRPKVDNDLLKSMGNKRKGRKTL